MATGFGILGAGSVSRHFVSSLRLVDGAKAVAVASRTEAHAAAFASEFGIPSWYSDYENLVADPRVDVVYVATPAGLHHEHSLLAISAGKAVLCEKPFTTNATRAREVAAAARGRGVFCMEAMWMRFLPLMRELERRVDHGDIGALRHLSASLFFPIPFAEGSRYYDPELGGGALLDLGVYPVSLASMLLGRPRDVQAMQTLGPTGVDAQMTLSLEYPEALAALSCGFTGTGSNGAYIVGSEGHLEVDAPIYAPTTMRVTHTGVALPSDNRSPSVPSARMDRMAVAAELRRRLGPRLKPILRRNQDRVAKHFRGHGYQYEVAEVLRCLDAGQTESRTMPLDETVAVMDILDAARSAAEH